MAEIKAPALSPKLMALAEYSRSVFIVTVPPGVPLASVTAPEFWAHCADKLKPYNKIECRAQDNKWYAELLVRSVSAQAVSVWVLSYADLEAQSEQPREAGEYTVSFAPKQRWRVIRSADGVVVHKDCATEAEARAWLVANAQTLAG